MWRKGKAFALLVQNGAATVESSMEIPQKHKHGSAVCPVIPLLGIYPREPKTLIHLNVSNPVFVTALFTIAKIWKQPKCPSVHEWAEQLWDIYTVKYYSAIKKKKISPFVTLPMDLEYVMVSEVRQSKTNTN